MLQALAEDIELDMGAFPEVAVRIRGVGALRKETREATMAAVIEALSRLILGTHQRGLTFALTIDLFVPVTELFADVAPMIVDFALAMGREDLLRASETCMRGTTVRFHSPGDAPIVDVVAQLIEHIPQGAPVRMTMA